jgi:phytoene dehydrogenase-like protein
MTVQTADAVVVGAGHNGLVAANVLADAGWDVLVLESQSEPGGAVRTAETTADGFHNDLCSAFFPMTAASPVMRDLALEDHGLVWRHAPRVATHVFADDRAAVLSTDVLQTAESVSAFSDADGDAWCEEFEFWQRIREPLLDAILRPFPPVRAGSRLLRVLGSKDAVRFARRLTLPVRRFGQERFHGEGVRALLAGHALHSDLGPDTAGSTLFGWLLCSLGQDVGFPVPEGGAGRITDALVRRLESHGGRVVCDRGVTRVLVAGGRAMGVRDVHGEVVRARKAVLADVPAPRLFRDLVGEEHLPTSFRADLDHFDWDYATIKVDWALSGAIPWSNPDIGLAGTVHLGGDVNQMARFAADLSAGEVPEYPFILLGQMTTADPTRSPKGTESVWAYTHVPRGLAWDRDRLQRFADRLEGFVERHAPGLRDLVIARRVSGPGDIEAHNPGVVGGAINHGTSALHQELLFRPVPGLGRADTPIDRLFLSGASAHPGGAVHGAPGANAARAALARCGVAGPLYATAVRAAHRMLHG